MKILLRILGVFLLAVLVGGAALFLMRDSLIARAAVRAMRDHAGLDVSIERVRTTGSPLAVQLIGFEIRNPPGFDEDEALRIDEFYVSVDRRSLTADEVRLPEARLRLPRLVVIQREDGRTNLEQIGQDVRRAQRGPPPEPAPGEPAEPRDEERPPPRPRTPEPRPTRERSFRIDRLTTYIGEVEVREYREGSDAPRIRRVKMDREMVFEDVTDFQPVLRQLTAQLAVAALPQLLEELQERGNAGESLREIGEDLRDRTREWRRSLRDGLR